MAGKKKLVGTLIVLVIVACIIFAYLLVSKDDAATGKVKIVERGLSACTMDFPTSTCGSYKVMVESESGERFSYTVAGFGNAQSQLYDKITPKISKAYDQKSYVILKTNDKKEIISVQ